MTAPASALYVGRVEHRRIRPRPHALAYRVFWMLLDLDEIDDLHRRLKVFSRDRRNLFSFRTADYGDRSGRPLRPQVEARLAEAGIETGGGPIRLLTMPRVLGYGFNPISVFFCHRADGALAATIYEVHNTFGEIHSYLIAAEGGARPILQDSAKAFHVSPFLTRDMAYRFRLAPPGDDVALHIAASDGEGPMLFASLAGNRRELTDGALLRLLVTHPLLTLKVTAAIHWHALLLLAKRIRLIRHPGPAAGDVTVGRQSG
ncbi:DUF1365 domain-containing protein [Phreatobacter cathodiphilus]|uniref:DUF1365 domain-containing protein n=1 Tax=Phreatobacter cathodiphilus TaxID=1868589 RepID=A0A2S0NDD6_9HYPH|nr:DUF1365 family protein [Phreatobacter cathodiphilus]AVO46189.1 DUF1365 domain-containing protein [Phreatobacter cathodiphilus]